MVFGTEFGGGGEFFRHVMMSFHNNYNRFGSQISFMGISNDAHMRYFHHLEPKTRLPLDVLAHFRL